MTDLITQFDVNNVFTEEQKHVINAALNNFVSIFDNWMYNEVLPKTINGDGENYGSKGIIEKQKTFFKNEVFRN